MYMQENTNAYLPVAEVLKCLIPKRPAIAGGRKNVTPWVIGDLIEQMQLNERTDRCDQSGKDQYCPPSETSDTPATRLELAPGLHRYPQGAMFTHCEKCRQPDDYREPVQDADLAANPEVGPQRQKEVASTVERNAANDIPDCGA
jgi:hypothetical protein